MALPHDTESLTDPVTGHPTASHSEETIARTLTEIWSTILAVPVVSRDESFLSLGGESLLAIQVRSRILTAFGVEASLRSILLGTIGSLASEVHTRVSPEPEVRR